MSLDYVIIGKRIREERIKKNMRQSELAELSGIEPSNISHIERAATKVSLPTLIRIANALEITLDELVYTNINCNTHISNRIINDLLSDCSADELAAIAEIIKTLKPIIRKVKNCNNS